MTEQTTESIGILLADDHALFRAGLRRLLSGAGMQIVAEAASGQSAVDLTIKHCPDVVVMDLAMAPKSGLEATMEILMRRPNQGVLMLSGLRSSAVVKAVVKAGARGFLLKTCESDELVIAIRKIRAGGIHIQSDIQLTDSARNELTDRELETIRFVAEGKSNLEIAEIMGIQTATVRAHVSQALKKLGLKRRTQLLLYALATGIATLETSTQKMGAIPREADDDRR